ncbi:MAG: MFS transporter [Chlamydiota bacterium]|nr:MFS transporter [Chlamydiota bacterium]
MFQNKILQGEEAQKTGRAFLWSRICDTPFWAIFNMLPFILYKDLHATPLQLAIIIALKPLSSIFSMYWSSLVDKRRDRLLPNIIWGGALRHLPFFFFPFMENPWFFIVAFGFHMVLSRGAQPAWIEVLKINIPGVSREKVFAYGSALGYVGDAILPFALGWVLDGYLEAWRWIFPVTAALSLMSIFWQKGIPIPADSRVEEAPKAKLLKDHVTNPWKAAWRLVAQRSDFARFQVAFMIAGSGLMIMQPAMTIFFVDELNLSYTQFAVALTAFKGLGFALTSPLWANWINRVDIYRFTSLVTALLCLFPFFLIMSQQNIAWLYLGYLGYGIMQAGSTLSWNMSGPIFARDEESSTYTSVNVVTVGLRGCIAPALGSLLCTYFGSIAALVLGGILCVIATQRLVTYSSLETQRV